MDGSTSSGGMLMAVVGPSGVGKDSVIGHAHRALEGDSRVMFVRRVVTRLSDGHTEAHDSLTPEAFAQARYTGAFAVTWEAHGLSYGLPRLSLDHVAGGGVAIANGSRAALGAIRAAFPAVMTVGITARPEVIAHRLAARGRETAQEASRRIRRSALLGSSAVDVEIDNSGALADAGESLLSIIRRVLDPA